MARTVHTAAAARRPEKSPRRRTQAERTALSEKLILRAAIKLIARQGYSRTTLAEIGKEAGYSGGLVILCIAFVDELVHVLRGFAPRYELPKPQSAEEVVERAMQSGV